MDLLPDAQKYPMLDVSFHNNCDPFSMLEGVVRQIPFNSPDATEDQHSSDNEYESDLVFAQAENSNTIVGRSSVSQSITQVINLKDAYSGLKLNHERSLFGYWKKEPWETQPVCTFTYRIIRQMAERSCARSNSYSLLTTLPNINSQKTI